MYKYCLIYSVVPNALEEDPPSEKGYLQRIDVDIDAVIMPSVGAYRIGQESGEETIEV